MFYGTDDYPSAWRWRSASNADNGEIVGLGRPGCEDDFVRVRPYQDGDLRPRSFNGGIGLPSKGVVGRVGVAVDAGPIWLHSLNHPWVRRGGCLIVKINRLECPGAHIILSLAPLVRPSYWRMPPVVH